MAVRYTDENDIEVRRTSCGFDIYRNGRFETSKFSERGVGDYINRDEYERNGSIRESNALRPY